MSTKLQSPSRTRWLIYFVLLKKVQDHQTVQEVLEEMGRDNPPPQAHSTARLRLLPSSHACQSIWLRRV